MKKHEISAVYPGSFDPPTNGHVDIIKRSSAIFSKVIVAVTDNRLKDPTFNINDRKRMIEESTRNMHNVEVCCFSGLLVDFIRKNGAKIIIRGLRAISDFDYEFQMALVNRQFDDSIETIFLIPDENYTYLSSSLVKELSRLNGNISKLVPPGVEKKLKEKFKK